MQILLTFIILTLCFLVFVKSCGIWRASSARRRGLLPEKGKATMFDVRRLILEGEEEMAVRLYCEIFRTGSREAQVAVRSLADHIHNKNSRPDPGRDDI